MPWTEHTTNEYILNRIRTKKELFDNNHKEKAEILSTHNEKGRHGEINTHKTMKAGEAKKISLCKWIKKHIP